MQASNAPAPPAEAPVAAIVPPAPVEPPAPTIVPPVPVVVLAFHPILAPVESDVYKAAADLPPPRDERIGSELLVAIEVEIIAEASDRLFRKRDRARLFVGSVLEAKGWLDARGYQYVLGSNARWAA